MTAILYLKRPTVIISAFLLALVLLMPTGTRAELASYFDTAMPDWQDNYVAAYYSASEHGYIQYAVYAPGNLPSALDNATIDKDQYVYAFQLFNDGTSTTNKITYFSDGLDPDVTVSNITEVDDPGTSYDNAASDIFFAPTTPPYTSAVWKYTTTDTKIGPSYRSKILLFNSPYGPYDPDIDASLKFGSMHNVIITELPSPNPTPEPASFLSLILAGCMFFLFRALRGEVFK